MRNCFHGQQAKPGWAVDWRFDRQIVEQLLPNMQVVAFALTFASTIQGVRLIAIIAAAVMAAENYEASIQFAEHDGIESLHIIPAVVQAIIGLDFGLIFTTTDAADIGIVSADHFANDRQNQARVRKLTSH